MERKNLSKTGQMLLTKNSPNRYPNERIYKTGPNFLNKFSSRIPTDDELKQAQTSLSLLKSKMKFNTKGRGNKRRKKSRQMDDLIGDFSGQNAKRGGGRNGKGNYRKVFKPNSQLENINKREERLMNNIDMLDDNLDMQREILGSHSHHNLPPKRKKRGGRFGGPESKPNRTGGKRVQNFDDDEDMDYDANKYREGKRRGEGYGVSSTSTAHTRRKENRRAGKTPPRRHGDNVYGQGSGSRNDVDYYEGKNKRSSKNMYEDDIYSNAQDPFAKGDNKMMGGGRDPFAKGDNKMMGGGRDPFAKGDNKMMGGGDRDPFAKADEGMYGGGGGGGNRRQEKSRSRRKNQQKRIKSNKYGDRSEYGSRGSGKRQKRQKPKTAWNNEVYDPYNDPNPPKEEEDDYGAYKEETTFGKPENFSRGKQNNRRKKPSRNREQRNPRREERNPRNEERRDNQGYGQQQGRGGRNKYEQPRENKYDNHDMGNNYASNRGADLGEERPLDKGGNPDNEQIMREAAELARVKLYPCSTCGKKFKKDSLAKHRKACKKVFASKRPKFDDLAMRYADDPEALRKAKEAKRELEREKKMKKKKKKGRGGFPANNKNKWQKQSEAFRAQIRMARGGKVSKKDEAIMKELANIGMVDCPHCSRSFGKKAADRHIPICAEKAKRKGHRGGGGAKTNNRRKRRTRY